MSSKQVIDKMNWDSVKSTLHSSLSVNIDYIYIKIPKSLWLGDLLILEIIIPNKFLLYDILEILKF